VRGISAHDLRSIVGTDPSSTMQLTEEINDFTHSFIIHEVKFYAWMHFGLAC
jgi:hypothetical protein